jgi:hypothetical protein
MLEPLKVRHSGNVDGITKDGTDDADKAGAQVAVNNEVEATVSTDAAEVGAEVGADESGGAGKSSGLCKFITFACDYYIFFV